VVLECETQGRDVAIRLWHDGAVAEVHRGLRAFSGLDDGSSYLEIFDAPFSNPWTTIVDLRDGRVISGGYQRYFRWGDADHVAIAVPDDDDAVELRWRDGSHAPMVLRSDKPFSSGAGRYYYQGDQRVDLATGAIRVLPHFPAAVGRDGILIDHTHAHALAPGEMPLGPLQWIAQ
jgi:hypothetical protein